MASGIASQKPPTTSRRDRTHWLYLAVIGAVVAGIAVGFLFPEFATGLKSIGTAFVGLIKMLIAPVIFCTIVLGIGSIRSASRSAGSADWRWATSFSCRPSRWRSDWLSATCSARRRSARGAGSVTPRLAATAEGGGGTTDFILGLIPTTLLSSLTEGSVLQALLVALLVGFAIQAMGRSGEPLLRGSAIFRGSCSGSCR